MGNFKDLGVHPLLVKRLNELNIYEPTPVQGEVIPYLLDNENNMVVKAQTGTGKTAAFGLPIIQKVSSKNVKIQALVLSPTRELVQQISKQLFKFTKYYDSIFSVAVYGGPMFDKQVAMLQKPTQIVVATPGRLMDLLNRQLIDLSDVKTVVLDEADEMLSMGFKEDIDTILEHTNQQANTWLFSATMPDDIVKIIKKYMSNQFKEVIMDEGGQVNNNIKHEFVNSEPNEKLNHLHQFLRNHEEERSIIFCNTKNEAQTLHKQLVARNYEVDVLHGDMTQKEREKVMRAFKSEQLQYLISTDVTARGIDVSNLNYVIHYQLPDQLDYYVHRAGRTARGGRKGTSLAFVSAKEKNKMKRIESSLNLKFFETIV